MEGTMLKQGMPAWAHAEMEELETTNEKLKRQLESKIKLCDTLNKEVNELQRELLLFRDGMDPDEVLREEHAACLEELTRLKLASPDHKADKRVNELEKELAELKEGNKVVRIAALEKQVAALEQEKAAAVNEMERARQAGPAAATVIEAAAAATHEDIAHAKWKERKAQREADDVSYKGQLTWFKEQVDGLIAGRLPWEEFVTMMANKGIEGGTPDEGPKTKFKPNPKLAGKDQAKLAEARRRLLEKTMAPAARGGEKRDGIAMPGE